MTQENLFNKKLTQEEKILKVLADGSWINGQYFLRTMMISQFHARILELERKGYQIEHSIEKDEYGFKSYRLLNAVKTERMMPINFAPATMAA